MRVLDPTGISPSSADEGADWRLSMQGRRLGVLWNGKPNADTMFRVLERRLRQTYGVGETVWVNKSEIAQGPARPATDEILNRLASGTVAVLTGSGD